MNDAYDMTYREINGCAPWANVTIGESDADILNDGRGFMSTFDCTMQLQVGCIGACLYCYVSNPLSFLTPTSVRGLEGELWGSVVRNKRDVGRKLRKALVTGRLADATVYWSGVTDPYAASPRMTKLFWDVLSHAPHDERPRRIAIQTRFRPDRDRERIEAYVSDTEVSDKGPAVVVNYSIGTDRTDIIRAWEKATPTYEERMKCVSRLRESNIFVVVTLSPFSLWRDLPSTLRELDELGVAYVSVLFFKREPRGATTPPRFIRYLEENHPQLLDESWQGERVEEIRSVLGPSRVLVGKQDFASLVAPHLFDAFAVYPHENICQ